MTLVTELEKEETDLLTLGGKVEGMTAGTDLLKCQVGKM
jgi:hypothetical protein